MFILGLFCVDVNVVGGNRGKVERGFSTWDVYGELNDNLIISCSDAQHILERLWLSLVLAASWAHGKRTK